MTDLPVTTPPARLQAGSAPVLEEALSAAVAGCPDVAALSGGPFGEVATYLAGRRIPGVRLLGDSIEIHVIARWGTPLPSVAQQVRSACEPFAGGRRVDVTIDDVVGVPGDSTHGADSSSIAPSTPHITPEP